MWNTLRRRQQFSTADIGKINVRHITRARAAYYKLWGAAELVTQYAQNELSPAVRCFEVFVALQTTCRQREVTRTCRVHETAQPAQVRFGRMMHRQQCIIPYIMHRGAMSHAVQACSSYYKEEMLLYVKVTTVCLEWVVRVYTSKLTPNSVVIYLFHDCERSHGVIVLPILPRAYVGLRWSKYSTHSTVLPLRRVAVYCAHALFEGLKEFCLVFRFVFCATWRIERLHFCYYWDVWRIFAHFVANTVAHAHRRGGCVAVFMTCHVYSADQLCALNRDCCSDC